MESKGIFASSSSKILKEWLEFEDLGDDDCTSKWQQERSLKDWNYQPKSSIEGSPGDFIEFEHNEGDNDFTKTSTV